MIEQEEIKKLIQSGFDLELISFELDIPIDQVRQCKIELENKKSDDINKTTYYNDKDIIEKNNNQVHFKIMQMREKYMQLYLKSNRVEVTRTKPLSEEEMEQVKNVIAVVEEKIKKMKTLSKKEKKSAASDILSELKKIEEYQLPMEEAQQVYNLICSEELQSLNTSVIDRIDYYVENKRRKCANQYAKAIAYESYDVSDIEELKVLERRITRQMQDDNPIPVGAVKSSISNKILLIQKEDILERMRNNIPENIMSIIQDLANGNVDIKKANEIIDEETKKRVESKTKNRFSLTEEQERRQILIQIRKAITEKTDSLILKNPERTILQIQELCGGELELSVQTVIRNLIGRNEFDEAKSICTKFSDKNKEETNSVYAKYMRGIRNEIRHAEISDIVMKLINNESHQEEECFSLIEKGLKMGNVNLRAVYLGKTKDGLKTITLADIWDNEKQKSR